MWPLAFIYVFLFSYLSSIVLVKISMRMAYKLDLVDRPSGRKVHTRETPLLGGLGIFLGLLITIIFNYNLIVLLYNLHIDKYLPFLKNIFIHVPGMIKVNPRIWGILCCGFIVFLVGLYDDKYGLSPKRKLLFEFLIAFLIVYFFKIKISLFIDNEIIKYVITILWIVGITNAFNLLDNMDGLSAGVALVSASVFFLVSFIAGQLFIGLFLIAFIGVLLGFLKYNFPPAKIFMGDAGSLFIGFNLSVITILGTYYIKGCSHLYPVFMPMLILGVAIYDTLSVIVIRIKNKESIFKADKNHFSHRLMRLGMSHRGVALFVYLVTFCVAINSVLLPKLGELGVIIVLIQTLCILSILALLEYYGKNKFK